MADRTLQILPGGQSSAPFTYTIPASTSFTLLAVRAVLDGTAAAGAFLPCVQLVSDAGVVMAETIGSSVAAGGSADASFFPLRRGTTAVTPPTFSATVLSIAPANTLRGYWRLGEVASPFADSSGWSGGPNDMNVTATGTAYTTHVAGALPPAQDDGALQFNAPISGGYYLTTPLSTMWAGVQSSFTVMAWMKPIASASNWVGGVLSNETVVAGAPSHEEGWYLSAQWDLGTVYARLFRVVNTVRQATIAVIPAGVWTFVVATYDGTTSRLYINGALADTNADARAQSADAESVPTISRLNLMPGPNTFQFYGGIDEVAFWGTVLSASDVATLYAAGLP